MVVYDEGRFYPHHNLYHVVVDEAAAPAERWDLQALATVLRSSTQGKANFTMEFKRYAPAPNEVAEGLRKVFLEKRQAGNK